MSRIAREAIVPYTCRQMYDLVTDVTSYPEFISWCNRVDSETLDQNSVKVRLGILYKKTVDLSFTTINTNTPDQSVEMKLADGPFSRLRGCWYFNSLGEDGCKVIFQLDYEFRKSLKNLLVKRVFNEVSTSLLDAFRARAQQKYGTSA